VPPWHRWWPSSLAECGPLMHALRKQTRLSILTPYLTQSFPPSLENTLRTNRNGSPLFCSRATTRPGPQLHSLPDGLDTFAKA